MATLEQNIATSELDIDRHDTLIDLLKYRAETQPDELAYGFLDKGEVLSTKITYLELHQRAKAVAKHLQNIHQGEARPHVMLLFPSGIAFIEAFFGCLYAGAIAVPASLPQLPNIGRTLLRLQAIVENSDTTIILTTSHERDALFGQIESFEGLDTIKHMVWIASDKIDDLDGDEDWNKPPLTRSDIAYLQYTSGSTGTPSGVIITHKNLLCNLALFKAEEQVKHGTMVSWLPIFHDMGLLYGLLYPLYAGHNCYFMSPESFILKPVRWLNAISKYRGTHTAAPNFAYHICARKSTFEERQQIDLSSWKVALNAAEPVHADTLFRFYDQFSACGFKYETFAPGYGLAEATLKVSMSRQGERAVILHIDKQALGENIIQIRDRNDTASQSIVGCGKPLPESEVRIVNPDTFEACLDNQVGEIWLAGDHIAQGYWNNSAKTNATFHVSIRGESADKHYLRTGDLGFLHEGELFIAGRIKDLVIIRGRNHYPHDIEATVQQVSRLYRDGCGAAFSVRGNAENDNEERLIVVQETRKEIAGLSTEDLNKLWSQTRAAVATEHHVALHALYLIPSRGIMKTSSGKIQRNYTKKCHINGSLDVIQMWNALISTNGESIMEPTDTTIDLEQMRGWLVKTVANLLMISDDDVDADAHLEELGMDSQEMLELIAMLEDDFLENRYQLSQDILKTHISVTSMVAYVSGLITSEN